MIGWFTIFQAQRRNFFIMNFISCEQLKKEINQGATSQLEGKNVIKDQGKWVIFFCDVKFNLAI